LNEPKILEPRAFRHIRLSLHPEPEMIQIGQTYVAIMHALDEVVAQCAGQA
jgi:hypothetical protein